MRCPKCGNEIPEGYLYCEACGEDIHIVPDFEPEIESSMKESISGIVEKVAEETEEGKQEAQQPFDSADRKKKRRRVLLFAMLSGAAVFLTAVCIAGVWLYQNNSFSYQLAKAESCMAAGKQEKAADYYAHALELDKQNLQVRFALAELYRAQGEEEAFINQLLEIIGASYSDKEAVEKAYTKLINLYKEKKDYVTINELLLGCEDQDVVNFFQEYLAKSPEFSYQEGNYAEVVPLKLSSSTAGSIYYTEDGSTPDENSTIYAAPIFLETGDYVITAVFINNYGIKSDVVQKEYHIDMIKPSAPEVLTYSGEYEYPTRIVVEVPVGREVFYTADGSAPTDQSARYTGSIPMPLGKSFFKFIAYGEEGIAGEVTEREYELVLNTEIAPDDAVASIVEAMIERGKIYDHTGSNVDTSGKYKYVFQYAISIKDTGDFYVIAEVYEDTVGTQSKSGTNYAVNVYDGTRYKLLPDGRDNFTLEQI